MNRKRMLIKKAQAIMVRHEESLDYDTKVLYNQIRFITRHMSEEQLARTIDKSLSKSH